MALWSVFRPSRAHFQGDHNLTLTPEQKAAVAQWNTLGAQITDSSMQTFMDNWFTNIRCLIRAGFPIHSIDELALTLGERYSTFTVLGSGPSLTSVAKRLSFWSTPRTEALLCGPTALGALLRENIRPTVIVIADSNPSQYRHIAESKLFKPELFDVVLPVTADPSWYAPDSILDPKRLYFYLPYIDYMGDVNIGFNHILQSLFPDVHRWIAQAGSVGNLMLNVADMAAAESPDKRVRLAVDCSWIKGGPTRAPYRFDLADSSPQMQTDWAFNNRARTDLAEIPFLGETIQTDLISLSYAINMLYMLHRNIRDFPYCHDRYALVAPAAKLLRALAPDITIPLVEPELTSQQFPPIYGEPDWAYNTMLKLIECSNVLHNRLKAEGTEIHGNT